MDLYTDSDGPTLDLGVEARLNRLDPDLRVTFSKWSINPITSRPLEDKNGKLIPDPLFHLWRWDRDDQKYYYVAWYRQFTHAEVLFLESDPMRRMSPEQVMRVMRELQDDQRDRELSGLETQKGDVQRANARKIAELIFDNKLGRRDAKITSYPGQTNRSTPGQIEMDNKEAGWELPEEA